MALFNRKPRLPSYVGVALDELLQDPEWSGAIGRAGIDLNRCELVIRLSDGTSFVSGLAESSSPVILLGQGRTLAMALAAERDVKVHKYDATHAQLQVHRDGTFQIPFGPVQSLNAFMFIGTDNARRGTPEGDAFSQAVSAFLLGKLEPRQVFGTPQSLVAVPVEPSAPEFTDPEDALRWKLVLAVQSAFDALLDAYRECYGTADKLEKSLIVATSGFHNGAPIADASRRSFHGMAQRFEAELPPLLVELRERTTVARAQWNDLMFLFPGANESERFTELSEWCTANRVPTDTIDTVLGRTYFLGTDYGLTRESFEAETARVNALLDALGQ